MPARPRPLPARGRARPRQDPRGRDAGADVSAASFAPHPVHARPPAVRHRRHRASTGRRARRSTSSSGPVFANFVLADEINRAPAKVQSALLEVMAEHHVSIGGITHPVPEPFLVLATQNPIESRGRLPAARGAARPVPDEDRGRLPDARRGDRDRQPHGRRPARAREQVLDAGELVALQARRRPVYVTTRSSTTPCASCSRPASPARTGSTDLERATSRYGASPARQPRPGRRRPRRSRCSAAATTCCPRTSSTSRPTCCATGSCSSYEALPTASTPTPSWHGARHASLMPRVAPRQATGHPTADRRRGDRSRRPHRRRSADAPRRLTAVAGPEADGCGASSST